ncbi:FAD-dependent oxidoreductase [Citrifermentans bremense]|uniref:FAD-dependent oxidoreductase n=1 Tax=Citrifermentans bremense TaxID=60035 RepID=UPI00041192DB|nr:FAD-binding protein [Citrifermentans bremense]
MNPSVRWDKTVDVVVIGYGGAGATAAIAAHDAGAATLVLESASEGGGNTLASFGGFVGHDDPSKALAYFTALFKASHSERDEQLLRVFVEESAKTPDWLRSLDRDVALQSYGGASYPQVAGAEAIKRYVIKGKNKGATAFAQHLWRLLSSAVEQQRHIPVLRQTPAQRLVTGRNGDVVGVIAKVNWQDLAIQAKRGVILASGGYEFDQATLKSSVKGSPLHSLGHPGNRGDGVRMAQKVGAALWHMNGVSCAFGLKVPAFAPALMMSIGNVGQIFVDRNGNRFVNEGAIERHAALLAVDFFDSQALSYPRIPFYLIFDEKTRKRAPLSRSAGLGSAGSSYTWSKDNQKEIDNGWISKADTVAELARKLGIPDANLSDTVGGWNAAVLAGHDGHFGREMPEDAASARIDTGPFYGVEIHPALINTQGGPRRNERAQIVDPFGKPIPGLYGAGELGSLWGLLYQGGGNIAECLAFGRIAGANAAAGR